MPIDCKLVDGDLQHLNTLISGDDVIYQRAEIRLRTFLGEWILDTAKGIPYIEWSGRKSDLTAISLLIKAELEGITGVARADVRSTYGTSNRKITTVANVTLVTGDVRTLTASPLSVLGGPSNVYNG